MLLEVYVTIVMSAMLLSLYLFIGLPSLPKTVSPSQPNGKVSIIVPVRNEEDTIEQCIRSLINIDYADKEIIIVDGHSTDNTRLILERFKDRLAILDEEPLPEGWVGKNWACHIGYRHSSGGYLLFTDGDTIHSQDGLRRTVNYLWENGIDMLTLIPRLIMRSFWEKLIQPIMGFLIFIYMRGSKVNDDHGRHAMGNGQYILIRRSVYEALGGHEGVKGEIVEDLRLAQRAKRAGYKVRVLFGEDVLETQMYANLPEIWSGWVKNTFVAFGGKATKLIISLGLLFLIFLLPYFIALFGLMQFSTLGTIRILLWGTVASLAVYIPMGIAYARSGISPAYALLFPIGMLICLAIMATSFYRVSRGLGVEWKGRLYLKTAN